MYFNQESMIFYPDTLPADFRFSFPAHFEELSLKVKGATINALHFKVDNAKGVVFYFHGNAGSLSSWGLIALDFTKRQYDVLIPDYRGYGKSTGAITSEEELHDDAAIIYEFLQKLYPENRIIIYGRSIGTGIAVHLARMNKPRMLILESPYYSLKDLTKRFYPFMIEPLLNVTLKYTFRTDLWIPNVSCPIYLFHGTEDGIIPFDSSTRLLKLIKSEHELVTISGGGHNDLYEFALYHQKLDQFLR